MVVRAYAFRQQTGEPVDIDENSTIGRLVQRFGGQTLNASNLRPIQDTLELPGGQVVDIPPPAPGPAPAISFAAQPEPPGEERALSALLGSQRQNPQLEALRQSLGLTTQGGAPRQNLIGQAEILAGRFSNDNIAAIIQNLPQEALPIFTSLREQAREDFAELQAFDALLAEEIARNGEVASDSRESINDFIRSVNADLDSADRIDTIDSDDSESRIAALFEDALVARDGIVETSRERLRSLAEPVFELGVVNPDGTELEPGVDRANAFRRSLNTEQDFANYFAWTLRDEDLRDGDVKRAILDNEDVLLAMVLNDPFGLFDDPDNDRAADIMERLRSPETYDGALKDLRGFLAGSAGIIDDRVRQILRD